MDELVKFADCKTEVKLPKEVLDEFLQSAESINVQHLNYCDCMKVEIEQMYEDVVKQMVDEKVAALKAENRDAPMSRLIDWAKQKCIELVVEQNSGKKCEIEKKQIFNIVRLFASKYDLKDARAFMIVKSTINHALSSMRMQRCSNTEGVITIWYDKYDNRRLSVNPVEEVKREFDKSVIDAISVLDKIFEGTKNVNLNMSVEAKDVEDLFKDVKIVAGDYSEIN
jgi:hypothetical protein